MSGKPQKIQKSEVLANPASSCQTKISSAESILYALGIGFSKQPLDQADLNFTYERSDDFQIFPTMGTVLSMKFAGIDLLFESKGIPEFNPMGLLHGEQRLEVYKQLQIDVEYTLKSRVVDVLDKKSGALFVLCAETFQEKDLVMRNYYYIFVKGIGKFQTQPEKPLIGFQVIKNTPKRVADVEVIVATEPNQAILYRLAGDFNPLHIDPDMAAMGGFEKPILHGLCTYGLVAKAFVQKIAAGDQKLFKGMHCRFTSHVFPGETLIISFWKEPNGQYAFSAITQERKKMVIIGEIQTQHQQAPKL